MWRKEFSRILNDQFQTLRKRNSKFSLRAFSRKTGLSIGPLSDVLKSKQTWKLTPKRAAEILSKLEIKSSIKNKLLVQMGEQPTHKKEDLKTSDYGILTDWTYYPILFSFDLPAKLRRPPAIAKRLGIPEEKVQAVIEDLLRRKLLVTSIGGVIERPEVFVSTADGTPNELIHKYHQINLEISKRALQEQPVSKRDFTSLTFAGNESQVAFLREEIRKLYEKASSLADGGEENDAVFRLSVQLFPIEFAGD
jgi:uncharacterized protein (TIGR02147 family)